MAIQANAQMAPYARPQHILPTDHPGKPSPRHPKPKDLHSVYTKLFATAAFTYTGTKYMETDSYTYRFNVPFTYSLYWGWNWDTCIDYHYDTTTGAYGINTQFIPIPRPVIAILPLPM